MQDSQQVDMPPSVVDDVKGKKKKRRRIILLLIVLILVIFLIDIFRRANTAFDEMYEPFGETVVNLRAEQGFPPLNLGEDPFSILILGLDEGRSDSMMLATVNPNTGSTYLLSIPRDTMVTISHHGSTTRINHAFAYGGIDMAVNTVQDFLNIPIDFYASLDMSEFYTLVDAFGGVRVYNNTVDFSMGGYHFPLGYIDLTGSSAYYYVRMRMDDPQGDFGRQERQRDVLGALMGELLQVTTVMRYRQIFDATGEHVRTNLSLGNIITILLRYNRALRNITHLDLQAPGQLIGGMYLIPIPEEQRLAMSNRLRNHLELE